jgi:hypothetical protein
MSNITMNQPSRFGMMVGRRFGKLQLIRYVGRDQSSNDAVFDAHCECGRSEQVFLSQLQSGTKFACNVCNPPVREQNAREWLADERRKQADDAERKRIEAEQAAAAQQRQAEELRLAEVRRKQQALVNEVFGAPTPAPAVEERWSSRSFRRF